MTKEELLQTRYKVIADWPGSPLRIGCILQDDVESCFIIYPDGSKDLTSSYIWRDKANYPHLFKKLEWWEDRNENELPEYVRCNKKVLKVTWQNDPELKPVEMSNDINNFYLSLSWNTRRKDVTPATEEEFIKHNTL